MSARPSHVVATPGTALTTAWTAVAVLVVGTHAPTVVRAPVVVSFLCVAPGLAIVHFARRATRRERSGEGLVEELALAIGLSFALTCLTASALVYSHALSFGAVLAVVSLVTVAPALPGALRVARRRDVREFCVDASRSLGRRLVEAVGVAAASTVEAVGSLRRAAAGSATAAIGSRSVQRPFVLERPRLPSLPRRSLAARSTHALRRLGSDALRDRLLWPTLHRVLVTWAAEELRAEIWLVDDLHRRRRPAGDGVSEGVRGVWVTGVTGDVSVPLAWRVVEAAGGAGGQAWRSRLALEALDELHDATPAPPIVVSAAAFGSLATFRSGLESRGLAYLVKVTPATAVAVLTDEHELPPPRDLSAAEARGILTTYIAAQQAQRALLERDDGQASEPRDAAAGVVVLRNQHRLVVCADTAGAAQPTEWWLSNLPADTPAARLDELMRLSRGPHVDRARADLLIDAMQARGDRRTLQSDLTNFALACGFRAFDTSGGYAEAL